MYPYALLQTLAGGHHHGMYMGLHWAWWIVWLGIGAALVWTLARILAAPLKPTSPSDPERESPDEILRTRYARGEITDDEFRERRRALRRSR